jgi:hypothetical protein
MSAVSQSKKNSAAYHDTVLLVAIYGQWLTISILISKNLLAIPMLDYFLQANSSVPSLFIAYANEVSEQNITEKINIYIFIYTINVFV